MNHYYHIALMMSVYLKNKLVSGLGYLTLINAGNRTATWVFYALKLFFMLLGSDDDDILSH